jgi:hypothetical protein
MVCEFADVRAGLLVGVANEFPGVLGVRQIKIIRR